MSSVLTRLSLKSWEGPMVYVQPAIRNLGLNLKTLMGWSKDLQII